MKFFTVTPFLLLAGVWPPCHSVLVAEAVSKDAPFGHESLSSEDAADSETKNGRTGTNLIRGSSVQNARAQLPESLIAKLETPVHELAIEDRVGVVEELAESVDESLDALSNLDVSEYPEFESLLQAATEAGDGVGKAISDTIYFMRSAAKMLESGQSDKSSVLHEEPGDDVTAAIDSQFQRRTQQTSKKGEDSSRGHGDNGGPNSNKHRRTFPENDRSSFHHQTFHSAKYAHVHKMHDAMRNGDERFMQDMLTSLKMKADWHAGTHDEHGRRTQASISQQCERLVGCASRMSRYDLFVYFFSDDIDPTNGDVDTDIIQFDEDDIKLKYEKIQEKAKKLFDNNEYNNAEDCSDLLQQFHRTIELDGVPEWEGASVTQVCLAEGTTVFVDLAEVALLTYPDLAFLTAILEEPFRCAKEMQDIAPAGPFEEIFNSVFDFFDGSPKIPTGHNPGARDEHGQINMIDMSSPFESTSSSVLIGDYALDRDVEQPCYDACCGLLLGFDASFCDDNEAYAEQCATLVCPKPLKDKQKEASALGKKFQDGLDLMFGDSTSSGYVCGMKQAVLQGKPLPGSCCLDAPYQLAGPDWGYAYNCEMDCITEGPFFSGMSEETCHVYGGTFCPVSDCTDLMNCVDGFRLHENKAFALYVNASPIISNPTDPFECGRAREYFGFQDNFINDQQICDDIGQLALTRDFTILNEFFDQDGDGSGGGGVSPISGPKLESPQLKDAFPAQVKNGQVWAGTNFALQKVVAALQFAYSMITDFKCPRDVLFGNICVAVSGVATIILGGIAFALETIVDISEFTFGQLAEWGNVEQYEVYHNVDKIYGNMVATGEWLGEKFEKVDGQLVEVLKELQPTYPVGVKYAGCDGIDQDKDGDCVADNCFEDKFPPSLVHRDGLAISTSSCLIAGADFCLENTFKTLNDAKAYLQAFVRVEDDCASPHDLVTDLHTDFELCQGIITITPVHKHPDGSDCYNKNIEDVDAVFKGKSETFGVKVDGSAPVITCGFKWVEDEDDHQHQHQHQHILLGNPKTLVVSDEIKSDFVDTLFFYDIEEDDCDQILKVSVDVRTNEFTKDVSVILAKQYFEEGVDQPLVLVAPQWCKETKLDKGSACITDPSVSFRFYEIVVAVQDSAGNESSDTCTVIVEPHGHHHREGTSTMVNAITASSARYYLDSVSDLTWNRANSPSEPEPTTKNGKHMGSH